MKKSSWREELNVPSAVKKIINEFVDGGVVTVPTAVVATTTATSLLPWAVGAGALTAAAVATKGKKKKKKNSSTKRGHTFKTITTKNPQ